jgi:CheY-like chemotaxis protein
MPIVDGYKAVKKISEYNKVNEIKSLTPIIAYSGDSDKKDVYKYLGAGMTDYFTKGDKIDYLVDMIDFWSSKLSSS